MQFGDVIIIEGKDIVPNVSNYSRLYIYLGRLDNNFDRAILFTTTTNINYYKNKFSGSLLIKKGQWGFDKDCCIEIDIVFTSDYQKIIKLNKVGSIDDKDFLLQLYKNTQNPNIKNFLPSFKQPIKEAYEMLKL